MYTILKYENYWREFQFSKKYKIHVNQILCLISPNMKIIFPIFAPDHHSRSWGNLRMLENLTDYNRVQNKSIPQGHSAQLFSPYFTTRHKSTLNHCSDVRKLF